MGTPDWVRRVNVSTSDGIIDYVVADDEATIGWLASARDARSAMDGGQRHAGGQHHQSSGAGTASWGAAGQPRRRRLDPGAGMTIVESARAALIVAAKLAEDGMIPIAQTSGSKGIQVYAAIAPTRSKTAWSYVKQLNARCTRLSQTSSSRPCRSNNEPAGSMWTTTRTWPQEHHRALLDARTGTSAAATPVTWEELGSVRGLMIFGSRQRRSWRESPNMGTWPRPAHL